MTESLLNQVAEPLEIRAVIHAFIKKRLDDKLEKLKADDPSRQSLVEQYSPSAWLADAANRASQLKAVTHSLKPIHPDAKGTNCYAPPSALPQHEFVGSKSLGEIFDLDVVGNAAALDVYKLLQHQVNGTSLLEMAASQAPSLSQALSDSSEVGEKWMRGFASLTEPADRLASHTLAKQVFWPSDDDVHNDNFFHLVSPLHPTSLAHEVYRVLQEDRFGETAKAAREARRGKLAHSKPLHDYPHLAMQKLGGTKPQNISQLNSERRGQNLLLPSLPPVWRSREISPLKGYDTLFRAFGRRKEVRRLMFAVVSFLKSNPAENFSTREKMAGFVTGLIDVFFEFTGDLRQLPPGWTNDPGCELDIAERIWLDAEAACKALLASGQPIPRDVPKQICEGFANWFNARLQARNFPVGGDEAFQWSRELRKRIASELLDWNEEDTDALL